MFHGGLTTGQLIWAASRADEVNLLDLIKFGQGNRFSLERLEHENAQVDLTQYLDFQVPIFFLLGRDDWHVPAVPAATYFDAINAPCKRLVWFEQSAHNPPFEEPQKFNEVMVNVVRPVSMDAAACTSLK
jgi:pimeloyl-ACP methyl ester carboxylesterase